MDKERKIEFLNKNDLNRMSKETEDAQNVKAEPSSKVFIITFSNVAIMQE